MLKKILYCVALTVLLNACKAKIAIPETSINEGVGKGHIFPEEEISNVIRGALNIGHDSVYAELYKNNGFRPFWQNDSVIKQGLGWLKESRFHGLNPLDFNTDKIDSCLKSMTLDSVVDVERYARLDMMLTASIRKCGRHIRFSKRDPKNFHSGWNFPQPSALSHDSLWINKLKLGDMDGLTRHFEPKCQLYAQLRKELQFFLLQDSTHEREVIENPGFLLQKGDSNQYVLPIKRKLLNIHPDSSVSMAFNDSLRRAVVKLQKKHGLRPDGIVGKQTYCFLNWNRQRYVNALKVNLERLRWLPDSVMKQGLVINIAAQKASLFYNDSLLFASNVVVGKPKSKTRVFGSKVDYLVFNPCWTVPKSIATTTILRGLKRDSSYLQKRNMFLMINGKREITDSIDFGKYTAANFPFQVFQNTDPGNALGKVKFMFKNRYSIYLHDTPEKKLFKKDVRTFSHGCIRMQNPLVLAEIILKQLDHQSAPIEKHLSKGYPEKVYLNNPVPVNLVYLTCWFDEDVGQVIFGKDVYAYDYRLKH